MEDMNKHFWYNVVVFVVWGAFLSFVAGLILALATGEWRWLILTVPAIVMWKSL